MSVAERIRLVNLLGQRLPGSLEFAIRADTPLAPDHPLAGEISAALAGESASLPYIRANDVLWATVAPNAEELRRVIEDLRCWLLPSYGWEASPAVVSDAGGSGEMGALLLQLAPQGYMRWYSRRGDLETVIERLARMRTVIGRAPARQTQLRPTLEMLRRQFTLGLATGDYSLALRAVDEVDQRQLDSAPNTLSMRIRLSSAFGDDQAIVANPLLDVLLATRVPRRVIESVLRAHHSVFLRDAEAAGGPEQALSLYGTLADRLAGLAGNLGAGADQTIIAMAAYDAAQSGDTAQLRSLADRFPENEVVEKLAERLAEPALRQPAPSPPEVLPDEQTDDEKDKPSVAEAAPSPIEQPSSPAPVKLALPRDWSELPALLAAEASDGIHAFLQAASLDPDRFEPGDGEFIIEVFTDAGIMGDPARAAHAEQILTAVIDGYIGEDCFPRRERLPLYQAVLDIWSSSRAQSVDPVDGQLLLTLGDALLRLDGKREPSVAIAITRWWEARPVRARLAWLGEALEMLTDQSGAEDPLVLWYEGAGLIRVDPSVLSLADRHLWHRLGRRLGLDAAVTDEALGGPLPASDALKDPLLTCGFKKIAIVSLHERAAREAAEQIEERTRAKVLIVTEHAAGEGTASAASADVILFVWSATKHAVYRAFDKVRDRLEYVQGTGSASIVRALERRVLSNG